MADKQKIILVTGGTGNMGRVTVERLVDQPNTRVRVLVRPEEDRHPLVKRWRKAGRVELASGDLTDFASVARAVAGADVVLHLGGLVSPVADTLPEAVVSAVNVGGTRNVVEAIKQRPDADHVRLVYIGTVAETGSRNPPIHWGRIGDPINVGFFGQYAFTKTQGEAVVAESGLRHWVSLRQSGMAHYDLWRTSGPIMFHNPVNGVFEWSTANDSANLMAGVSGDMVPEHFWRSFYNIGGGETSRVINHEFMVRSMEALGLRDFRDILRPNWLATRNFHGQWFLDSDRLEALVPFREQTIHQFFDELPKHIPAPLRLFARLFPGAIYKRIKKMAEAPGGSLHWIATNDTRHIRAYFGSREEWEKIPADWDNFELAQPSREPAPLDHGYNESKPKDEWTLEDLRAAARFRGGKCHAEGFDGPYTPVSWECAMGHRFDMTPNLHLEGGHWCPTCQVDVDSYDQVAKVSPFFAQVWPPAATAA